MQSKGGSRKSTTGADVDARSLWKERHASRHKLHRITSFPTGISAPMRVRVYSRRNHFVLQWWDPGVRRTQSERINGDLVEAISRSREIDQRLEDRQRSGRCPRRVGHRELVERFVADLQRRADAGEIDPRTVSRYSSALTRHYLEYALQPDVERQYRYIATVNREFQLGFAAFLANVSVRPNGHQNSSPRPMRGQTYVTTVVRAMFSWGMDPEGGGLLPEGFTNPFVRRGRPGGVHTDQFGEPDITLKMASRFIAGCDHHQLRLFAPMVLYGLRASEPSFLFAEDFDGHWLTVPCRPELSYFPKGRREKRLPVIPLVRCLLKVRNDRPGNGLLYLRRSVVQGREDAPLLHYSAEALAAEFFARCNSTGVRTAGERRRLRDRLFTEAGAITYDNTVAEFRKLARRLNWPGVATLKDFRHLFATAMENGGMPEHYRKFLMGQSVGRAPVVTYTHLNEVRERYEEAVERSLQPLVLTIQRRYEEIVRTESS